MDQKQFEQEASALAIEVKKFEIVDQETYNLASEIGQRIKKAKKKIDEMCDPLIKKTDAAHKEAIAQKKAFYKPYEEAQKIIDEKQITWRKQEEARIEEEHRKAEELARKRAEDDALHNAMALQEAGMAEAAQEAIEHPVVIPEIAITGPAKGKGESFRDIWSAEVVDLMTLVKAVASGSQPLAYLCANESALNKAAGIFKGTVTIPGVVIKNRTILSRKIA
jgi:hypothetical protein